jgi:predicted transcriptional regulator
MLRDIERKVLRILWNFSLSHAGSMPYYSELRTKTGKRENEIKFILNKLKEQNFIDWDGNSTDSIKIIQGWEDEPNKTVTPPTYNQYL